MTNISILILILALIGAHKDSSGMDLPA